MISFVGIGIQGFNQLTLEGLQTLQDAQAVLTFEWDPGFFDRHSLKKPTDLRPLYLNGARDEDNYSRLEKFISQAEAEHGRIAVAVPGHPRLGVTILNRMQATDPTRSIHVVEGISSFCTMINDLRRDPLERGTLLIDANRFLLFNMETSPYVDHFFYHVCSVGTARTHWQDPSAENAIALLSDRLCEIFGTEHQASLVTSSTHSGRGAMVHKFNLGDLTAQVSRITFDTTLFVPAKKPRSVNQEFLSLLTQERVAAC